MKAGIFNLSLADIEGWMLLVPQSYLDASEEEVDRKTGGCGPGSIGDWFVPDTMYGESIYLACRIHDWMYGEGETLLDKFIADMAFDWNMKTLILVAPSGDTEQELLDTPRLLRATKYFAVAHYGGGDAFKSGETMRAKRPSNGQESG